MEVSFHWLEYTLKRLSDICINMKAFEVKKKKVKIASLPGLNIVPQKRLIQRKIIS